MSFSRADSRRKAKKLLDKINKLHDALLEDEDAPSSLDLELLARYADQYKRSLSEWAEAIDDEDDQDTISASPVEQARDQAAVVPEPPKPVEPVQPEVVAAPEPQPPVVPAAEPEPSAEVVFQEPVQTDLPAEPVQEIVPEAPVEPEIVEPVVEVVSAPEPPVKAVSDQNQNFDHSAEPVAEPQTEPESQPAPVEETKPAEVVWNTETNPVEEKTQTATEQTTVIPQETEMLEDLPVSSPGKGLSLHDRFMEKDGADVASRFGQKGIALDLRRMIDVNQRFLFIRELFSGNSEAYNNAVRKLNDMANMDLARQYLERDLAPQFGWGPENEAYQQFIELLESKLN
jgi:hypothetical protein